MYKERLRSILSLVKGVASRGLIIVATTIPSQIGLSVRGVGEVILTFLPFFSIRAQFSSKI